MHPATRRGRRATNQDRLDLFPCVKGFFQMREIGTFTHIREAVNDALWSHTSYLEGDTPGVNVQCYGNATLDSGVGIENPGNKDFLLIACGQARTVVDGVGSLAAYMSGGGKSFRVQPYYGLLGSGVRPSERIAPATNQSLQLPLVDGTDYVHAFGRNGNTILHYGNNGEINTNDISLLLQDSGDPTVNTRMTTLHNVITSDGSGVIDTLSSLGHSGVGKIDTALTGELANLEEMPLPHSAKYTGSSPDEWEIPSSFPIGTTNGLQNYYGVMLCVFENGLPDDYAQAIPWMKSKWIKGRKDIWPEWEGLR